MSGAWICPAGSGGPCQVVQAPTGVAGAETLLQTRPVQNTDVGEVAWMFWILLVLLLVSRAAFVVSGLVLPVWVQDGHAMYSC